MTATIDVGSEVAVKDRKITQWGSERGYRIGVVASWVRRPYRVLVRIGEVETPVPVSDLVVVTEDIRASIKEDTEFIRAQNLLARAVGTLTELSKAPTRGLVRYIPALKALLSALND